MIQSRREAQTRQTRSAAENEVNTAAALLCKIAEEARNISPAASDGVVILLFHPSS